MAVVNKDGFWIDKKGEEIHPGLIGEDIKLRDEVVEQLVVKAQRGEKLMREFKELAFSEVNDFMNLLFQEYKIDERENSPKGNITLENFSGTAKVQIQIANRISFDEKLSLAKIKLDEYLKEITENADPAIQTLILKAFEVDKKGEVNAKKILSLKSYKIEDPRWKEAMTIIDDAIEIVSSKSYIRFYHKNMIDKEWKHISLDIASV